LSRVRIQAISVNVKMKMLAVVLRTPGERSRRVEREPVRLEHRDT
jgi:hypothetical protein